ncbi:MAG: SufE family protein [Ignavibacteria bacterium]|nr:SufE family protein [Ignavibacteria bacterium]
MQEKTLRETEDEIIDEFSLFDDWMSKYEYIIELGKHLPIIDAEHKTEEFKIKGCQSQVWLTAEMKDGKLHYKAESDAVITKGIIALLIRVLSGHKPEEILNAELGFIDKIGMHEHLSPNRSNGLTAMINYMKNYAKIYAGQSVQ